MDRIKSALEKAMERAEQLEAPTEEERLEWKWLPEGRKLAATAMNRRLDVAGEVAKVEEAARPYLLKGLVDVLVENLRLPKAEHVFQANERVLEVLMQLKQGSMEELAERVRYVCTQFVQFYPQQQREAFEQVKATVQSQLEEAVRQQTGVQGPVQLGDIEARPEFQSQWLQVLAQLEEPYGQHLREFRQQIRNLP